VIGLALVAFAALFALDAFDGRPLGEAVLDFGVHLIPAMIVGIVVGAAWKRPAIGAIAFAALAVGYALMVPRRPDWILMISGPLVLVAFFFALSASAATPPGQAATRPRSYR